MIAITGGRVIEVDDKLIEIKVPSATLFLTPSEYFSALKRGKAILRARKAKARMEKIRAALAEAENKDLTNIIS